MLSLGVLGDRVVSKRAAVVMLASTGAISLLLGAILWERASRAAVYLGPAFPLTVLFYFVAMLVCLPILGAAWWHTVSGVAARLRGKATTFVWRSWLALTIVAASIVLGTGAIRDFRLAQRAGQSEADEDLARVFQQAIQRRSTTVLRVLAANPRTPAPILHSLAGLAWPELQTASADFGALLFGEVRPVLVLVAQHPAVSVETLSLLANTGDLPVQAAVAGNPRTSPGVLETLAVGGSARILAAVAHNPTAPLNLLLGLSRHESWVVRLQVAGHQRSSPALLEVLASDPEWRVRRAVAGNDAAPRELLEGLLKDPSEEVQRVASTELRGRNRDEATAGPAESITTELVGPT